jgi:CPA1 family monovalent cation:H+ antiporter
MTTIAIAFALVGLAALLGYVNYRLLRLPPTAGVLALTQAGPLLLFILEWLAPSWLVRNRPAALYGRIEFKVRLMRGILG